jgi:hypothetical protein
LRTAFEAKPPAYIPFVLEANGVDPKRAVGVASAWYLLELAAHMLDKVEDQELELIGVPQSARGIYKTFHRMIFAWILNHPNWIADAGRMINLRVSKRCAVYPPASGSFAVSPIYPPAGRSPKPSQVGCSTRYVGTRRHSTNPNVWRRGNFGEVKDDYPNLG